MTKILKTVLFISLLTSTYISSSAFEWLLLDTYYKNQKTSIYHVTMTCGELRFVKKITYKHHLSLPSITLLKVIDTVLQTEAWSFLSQEFLNIGHAKKKYKALYDSKCAPILSCNKDALICILHHILNLACLKKNSDSFINTVIDEYCTQNNFSDNAILVML